VIVGAEAARSGPGGAAEVVGLFASGPHALLVVVLARVEEGKRRAAPAFSYPPSSPLFARVLLDVIPQGATIPLTRPRQFERAEIAMRWRRRLAACCAQTVVTARAPPAPPGPR
jgi:hypothetical protein